MTAEAVNHPDHYNLDPSGIECIEVVRHRNFAIGSAIKYLWRAGLKDEPGKDARAKHIEDLRKAVWYIEDEISRLRGDFARPTETVSPEVTRHGSVESEAETQPRSEHTANHAKHQAAGQQSRATFLGGSLDPRPGEWAGTEARA